MSMATFRPILIAGGLVVALMIAGELVSPGFASPEQILRLSIVAALLGIVAAGQNLVILGGREGIDLSVGGVISLSALVAGNVMNGLDAGLLPAILACVAVGAIFGLLNGLGVTLLRIPPLVMTLGMLGVLQGLLVVARNGIPSGRAAPMLSDFVSQPQWLGLPGILWLWALIGLAMAGLLGRTVFGQRIFAIGANEPAARLAGVPTRLTRTMLYVLSGVFSAIAGLCILGYSGSSFANVGGQYMLSSIIAVVLGGTPLSGGRGGYTGTMIGALLLVVLQGLLTTLSIEESGRQIIFGSALIVLLLFYGRSSGMRV
ncbi:MAG: ABC transporter permease [Pseudomonadota bacterium]|jgi:ribose transport system permease protein|uniref:Monosaccharide ABC transporter membrane protein, CUT2 family n=2 Tax=Pseudooceanicola nitratireducens TaxID=517719 RepID=A0A1I1PZN1_9RHOB|nr:ABC transporter permease [Pseudooceanicola nitratireducens]MEC7297224.1 ABC transporter permease [Pseudomonadota bacterium]MEC7793096.1 ABC transporter permease [Pseudomonadota bacterium]MEC8668005.1 ABC transporter permease [Pseudomonadota bacterium]MEC9104617.1 ABC transporter permease [Pseudomonadota bacterium]SEJ69752.1 ribose transport system permease protein [Pseudooceanicola nitratireducens]